MKGGKLAIIIVLIILILVAVGGGIYYYISTQDDGSTYSSGPSYGDYYGGGGETQPYYDGGGYSGGGGGGYTDGGGGYSGGGGGYSDGGQTDADIATGGGGGGSSGGTTSGENLDWEDTSPFWFHSYKARDSVPGSTPLSEVKQMCADIASCKYISRQKPDTDWLFSKEAKIIRYNPKGKSYRNTRAPDYKLGHNEFQNYTPYKWKIIPGMATWQGKGENVAKQYIKFADGPDIGFNDARKVCAMWGKSACQAITKDKDGWVMWKTLKRGPKNSGVKAYLAEHHPNYDNPSGFNYS